MDDGSLSEVDGARTNFYDGFRVVTDVKDGRARRNNVLDFVFALSFETRVTDAQRILTLIAKPKRIFIPLEYVLTG